MAKIILLTLGFVLANGLSQGERDANILRSESEVDENGNFLYSFDTSNKIGVIAAGRIKDLEAESDDQIQEIVGCYSYIDTNGNPVVVTYTANERGYQPIFTDLESCPDLNALRGGQLQIEQEVTPPPRSDPRPPKRDDGVYRVIDENGNVVATLPKSTNLLG